MTSQFIITKEHRRFAEFADAVREQNTIGVCFGPAGVGKTLSARRYAHWDSIGPIIARWAARSEDDTKIYAAADRSRTIFYTPEVSATMCALQDDLGHDMLRTEHCIEEHLLLHGRHFDHAHGPNPSLLELIIIDESELLTGNAIEWLRDQYDRTGIPMILIGMPGIEKQFTHYPQLYSRLGFAHQYRPLGHDELLFVLERQWRKLGKTLDPDDFTDAQAIAAVERITRGNFRLLERLLPQIQRVLKINELDVITNDVVEAARSTLVIGTTWPDTDRSGNDDRDRSCSHSNRHRSGKDRPHPRPTPSCAHGLLGGAWLGWLHIQRGAIGLHDDYSRAFWLEPGREPPRDVRALDIRHTGHSDRPKYSANARLLVRPPFARGVPPPWHGCPRRTRRLFVSASDRWVGQTER